MNPSTNELIEKEHDSIYQTYKRLPIAVSHAKGARIYSVDGDVYLDFLSGIAVNALGHCHEDIIKAVEDQIRKYMHISNYFYQEPQIMLAEKLQKYSGLDKVFFCNSGTEATEGFIKLARKWGKQNGKKDIIAFSGGFHGRTYGALSIMDKPLYKNDMEPFLENCKVIKFNDVNSLYENINQNIAAVILEFIQGEGGVSEVSQEFVNSLNELKNKFNFLLAADEIQAGFGRTGKFFGFEHFKIKPDIITCAKGMGGGLPLGAIIVSSELSNIWQKGNHGTTYGGNAVACRAGLAVIENLEKSVLVNVAENGTYLHSRLNEIKSKYSNLVLEVRGRGFIKGLLLNIDAQILVDELLKHKVIANACSGNVLRIVPPLIVNELDINEFILKLDKSIENISIRN